MPNPVPKMILPDKTFHTSKCTCNNTFNKPKSHLINKEHEHSQVAIGSLPYPILLFPFEINVCTFQKWEKRNWKQTLGQSETHPCSLPRIQQRNPVQQLVYFVLSKNCIKRLTLASRCKSREGKTGIDPTFFQTSAAIVPANSNVFPTPTPSVMPPLPVFGFNFFLEPCPVYAEQAMSILTPKWILYLGMLKNLSPSPIVL